MTCRNIRKQLVPWLDNQLPAEQADRLRLWLESCERVRHCSKCHPFIQEQKALNSALSTLPQPELPPYVHARIMDRIQSAPIAHTASRRSVWKTIPVAAAILLSFYIGSMVSMKTFSTSTTVQTTSAQTTSSSYNLENYSLLTVVDNWVGTP